MSKVSDSAAAGVFFALGDPTRLAVLRKLGGSGALSATALSDGAKVTRQAIVKHLQVLEGAGLVTHDRNGREVLYAVDPARLDDARVFLDAISQSWDRAIGRLRRLVEEPPFDAAGGKAFEAAPRNQATASGRRRARPR